MLWLRLTTNLAEVTVFAFPVTSWCSQVAGTGDLLLCTRFRGPQGCSRTDSIPLLSFSHAGRNKLVYLMIFLKVKIDIEKVLAIQ